MGVSNGPHRTPESLDNGHSGPSLKLLRLRCMLNVGSVRVCAGAATQCAANLAPSNHSATMLSRATSPPDVSFVGCGESCIARKGGYLSAQNEPRHSANKLRAAMQPSLSFRTILSLASAVVMMCATGTPHSHAHAGGSCRICRSQPDLANCACGIGEWAYAIIREEDMAREVDFEFVQRMRWTTKALTP